MLVAHAAERERGRQRLEASTVTVMRTTGSHEERKPDVQRAAPILFRLIRPLSCQQPP
jgi:hypothetical protein